LIIGVPKEIKKHEYRVAMTPGGVRALTEYGHTVMVEKSAGLGSGITDEDYVAAGAKIIPVAETIFKEAEMIVKVKEPLPREYDLLQEGEVLFTYLHLAPAPELTKALLKQKIIGIAYETVQLDSGALPLLIPMSEIAGKLAVQAGAHYLQKENGGSGVLLGGVPGVRPGNVVVIGGGSVGTNAAKIALGMGANVIIFDINLNRLRYLSDVLEGRLMTLASNAHDVEAAVADADLVIGGLLIPGARAKRLITREMIKGSVIVDVAIDQGGCCEASIPTTHESPVLTVDGVIIYCVANMPGCVSRTSTFALTNATIPYIIMLANLGYKEALQQDTALRKGINVCSGKLVNKPVAESLDMEYTPYETLM
jgi:alanine dehydrogenase